MKKITTLALLLLVTTSIAYLYGRSPITKPRATPTLEESSPMTRFMSLHCSFDKTESELIAEMRKQSKTAEAYFIEFLEKGPNEQIIKAAREDFAKHYTWKAEQSPRQVYVRKGKEAAQQWKAPEESQDRFIDRKLKALEQRLMLRALEGLAALRSRSAQKYLEEKANDRRFPLQELAAELLR